MRKCVDMMQDQPVRVTLAAQCSNEASQSQPLNQLGDFLTPRNIIVVIIKCVLCDKDEKEDSYDIVFTTSFSKASPGSRW